MERSCRYCWRVTLREEIQEDERTVGDVSGDGKEQRDRSPTRRYSTAMEIQKPERIREYREGMQ